MSRFQRRKILAVSMVALGSALSGCASFSKPRPLILPPYIHSVAVRPFSNHTQQYGLEDKLTIAVQSEFNQDGRVQITTEDHADGVTAGDITRYILEPLSYDANHIPTQYKLTVLVDVSFFDKVRNQMLWREPGMAGELRYFVASSGLAGSLTEVDAQQVIWEQLAKDIRTRTFEGFGTVTGPDKTGTKSNLEQLPNPADGTPPAMPSQEPPAPSPTQLPY